MGTSLKEVAEAELKRNLTEGDTRSIEEKTSAQWYGAKVQAGKLETVLRSLKSGIDAVDFKGAQQAVDELSTIADDLKATMRTLQPKVSKEELGA